MESLLVRAAMDHQPTQKVHQERHLLHLANPQRAEAAGEVYKIVLMGQTVAREAGEARGGLGVLLVTMQELELLAKEIMEATATEEQRITEMAEAEEEQALREATHLHLTQVQAETDLRTYYEQAQMKLVLEAAGEEIVIRELLVQAALGAEEQGATKPNQETLLPSILARAVVVVVV